MMRTPRQIFKINLILIWAVIRHFGQQVAFIASFFCSPVGCERNICVGERVPREASFMQIIWLHKHGFNWFVSETPRHSHSAANDWPLVGANTFWLVSNRNGLATTIYGTAFDFKAAQPNHNNQTITYQPIEIFSRSNFVYNPIVYEIVVNIRLFLVEENEFSHVLTPGRLNAGNELSVDAEFAQNQKWLPRIYLNTKFRITFSWAP